MDMALQAIRKNLMVELLIPNDATHYTLYGGEYVWWKKESRHPGEEPVWFFANQYLVDNHASWAIYTQDIPQTGLTEIQLAEDKLKASSPIDTQKTGNSLGKYALAKELKPGDLLIETSDERWRTHPHPKSRIVMNVVSREGRVYVHVYNIVTLKSLDLRLEENDEVLIV